MSKVAPEDVDLVRRWRGDWVLFAEEALGVYLDDAQKAILQSIQKNPRTVCKSGHARGKDFIASVAAVCFLYLYDPSKVICTAPTGRQVTNIMLAEIKTRILEAKVPLGGELLADGVRFPNNPNHFLMGFKAGDEVTEAWTGFHSPNIMVIATEASGLRQQTFDNMEGLLTGHSRLFLALNPNRTQGEAYNAFKSPLYEKFTLSCMDAPNVLARKTHIPGQVGWDWVDTLIKKQGWVQQIPKSEMVLGEGDFEWEGKYYRPGDLFRIKVLGMWPREAEGQLIPLDWVEQAFIRWDEWKLVDGKVPEDEKLLLGVDVAGTGADMTVLCFRYGTIVTEFKIYAQADHMSTAGRVKQILDAHPDSSAYIDTIGEGAGIHSRLVEQHAMTYSVKFSGSAKKLKDVTGEREFLNLRAFCWWSLRDSLDPNLGGKLALPRSETLAEDLTSPLWSINSTGKIVLEKKDDIIARLGRSPDYGDALANTFFAGASRGGFVMTGLDVTPEGN